MRRALEGPWRLYYQAEPQAEPHAEQAADPQEGHDQASELSGAPMPGALPGPPELPGARGPLRSVPATVPGNVELDLSRAGELPADLFRGEAILAVGALEEREWWYETTFSLEEDELGQDLELEFAGVDGDADYFLNGIWLGSSDNSLIEHVLALGGAARPGPNRLVVHLRPLRPPPEAADLVPLWSLDDQLRQDSLWARKAPHTYGWDIMPRALSAGLWRPVSLVGHQSYEISHLYLATLSAGPEEAVVRLYYAWRGDIGAGHDYRVVFSGACGSSTFRFEQKVLSTKGSLTGHIEAPRLWWPRGYGPPDLYELSAELFCDGEVVARRTERAGVRAVQLVRKSATDGPGDFKFIVNGVPTYCRGTNWVPVDAFHGRDGEGLAGRLDLLWESNCNLVRCWGGNVYEDDAFYEFCDSHGIMVWQDFALACALYPQAPSFCRAIEAEVRAVARRLRAHPSVVVWCGDNEGDELAVQRGVPPSANVITRQVVPGVLRQEDPHRPYLPSSPFVDEEAEAALGPADLRHLPEAHLWGPRDYYKSEFYLGSRAVFVSEIGFMGLPAVESLRRFIDAEALWPPDNRQWLVHGTDPTVDFGSRYWWRTKMTFECARLFFGSLPANLADAVVASQVVQAEALKYTVETARQRKWERTGVIWWNLADGWPQISDAVADYYLVKKLAFHYVGRVQRAVMLSLRPSGAGRYTVLCCNDTRDDVTGTFEVKGAGRQEPLLAGRYVSPANQTVEVGELHHDSARDLLLIDWTDREGDGHNHHLCGEPPFDLGQYKEWLELMGMGAA